jgi:hypothetical protein
MNSKINLDDKKFPCINTLIEFVTRLGGRLSEIQGRICLIAPAGFLFNLINGQNGERIIYTGAGLCLENEHIMIPAGTLLTSNNGVSTYSTNFIKPINVKSIKIDLIPF